MSNEKTEIKPTERFFTEYCEKCSKVIKHCFKREDLQDRGGGLYSGIFLHKCKDNKDIHALMVYFDEDLAHRGGERSILIEPTIAEELLVDVGRLSEREHSDVEEIISLVDKELSSSEEKKEDLVSKMDKWVKSF